MWKAIAFGAVLIYLTKAAKANGGTLSQNPYGIKIDPDRIADFAARFAPQEWRPQARDIGKVLIERYL